MYVFFYAYIKSNAFSLILVQDFITANLPLPVYLLYRALVVWMPSVLKKLTLEDCSHLLKSALVVCVCVCVSSLNLLLSLHTAFQFNLVSEWCSFSGINNKNSLGFRQADGSATCPYAPILHYPSKSYICWSCTSIFMPCKLFWFVRIFSKWLTWMRFSRNFKYVRLLKTNWQFRLIGSKRKAIHLSTN